MYLAILDDAGMELAINRIALYDVPFRMSPGRNEGEQCSFINAEMIVSSPLGTFSGWAAVLALCEEPDSLPFAMIPLDRGRMLFFGEALSIGPGQLVLGISDIGPSGRSDPDPHPVTREPQQTRT